MDYLARVLIWSLSIYGCANIIVFSTLFKPIREFAQFKKLVKSAKGEIIEVVERKFQFFKKLMTCVICISFYLGGIWGLVVYSPANELIYVSSDYIKVIEFFFNAFLGSCNSWLIYLWIAPRMSGK